MLLSSHHIRELHAAAIDAHLMDQRETLLAGVSRGFTASLPRSTTPSAQLLLDLHRLNEVPRTTDNGVPLEAWLMEAVALTSGQPVRRLFQSALEEVRARVAALPQRPGSAGGARPRRRHFLDEAPFDFSRPEARSLQSLLEQTIDRTEDIRALLTAAGISRSRIRMDQPPRALWNDVLAAAASQGLSRRLVEVIAQDQEWSALRARLDELLGARPAGEVGAGPIEWKAGAPLDGLERQRASRATWVDVAFLAKGLAAARSVVRVDASFDGEALTGTGFFIAPGRLLTNHHVLFDEAGKKADRVELWLDYEAAADGSVAAPRVIVVSEPSIQGEKVHDWATVEVGDAAARAAPVLRLGGKRPARRGDFVSIIQHPGGLPKKLGIFRNEVQHADGEVVQYLTDTNVGSSGSPVFNEQWEVVALHHRWTAGTPAGQQIYNEGVAIERIAEGLRGRGLLP